MRSGVQAHEAPLNSVANGLAVTVPGTGDSRAPTVDAEAVDGDPRGVEDIDDIKVSTGRIIDTCTRHGNQGKPVESKYSYVLAAIPGNRDGVRAARIQFVECSLNFPSRVTVHAHICGENCRGQT